MYAYLLPLLIGFSFAGASAFTSVYSRRWGVKGGQLATSVLRNAIGIPVFMVGLILAWQADNAWLWPASPALSGLGWTLVAAGAVPIILGHLQLGWITHMPSASDTLFDQGLYAYVRHPIYAGSIPFFAGLLLLHPTLPWVLASSISLLFFVLMARLEEIDLVQRMPAYRQYMERVPRFIPHRLAWLCPVTGVITVVVVLTLWGLSWWTALLAAIMLTCPINSLIGMLRSQRYTDRNLDHSSRACCDHETEKGERHER